MAIEPDPYKILQVDSEAEDEVIQAAYRRLAQKYHPDLAVGPEAAERMVAINAAWELLRTPDRRKAFDRERRIAGARSQAPTGAFTAPKRPYAATSGKASADARPGSPRGPSPRPPETVSGDWTSGRSSSGGGYDASTMRAPEGFGAAGTPPGNPSGSVMNFGRYAGWSLGEISRADLEYIEWLDRMPIGRPYREEIDAILRRTGRRKSASTEAAARRGLFRRR
jgi:curved DNA-binding protein CbpA